MQLGDIKGKLRRIMQKVHFHTGLLFSISLTQNVLPGSFAAPDMNILVTHHCFIFKRLRVPNNKEANKNNNNKI